MLLYGMIFIAGVLHGLGPDHLAAITAFGAATGGGFRRVTYFALRFAAGHALVICVAGLAAAVGRGVLPAAWERRFDLAAGALLVVTGVLLLAGVITGHIRFHAHEHLHAVGSHRHWHLHLRRAPESHQHRHGVLAAVLGGLFALGGLRSLLLVVPVTLAATFTLSLLRIALFALGITVAMVAYSMLATGALARLERGAASSARLGHAVSVATALFCIFAGALTVAERLRL